MAPKLKALKKMFSGGPSSAAGKRNVQKKRNLRDQDSSSDEEEQHFVPQPNPQPIPQEQQPPVEELPIQPPHPSTWLEFPPGIEDYEHCVEMRNLLSGRQVELTRVIDWMPLRTVGLDASIKKLLMQTWTDIDGGVHRYNDILRVFMLNEPVYPQLCVEFFSTIDYSESIGPRGVDDDEFLRFRMGGVSRRMSLREFAIALGIYTPGQINHPRFPGYLMAGDVLNADQDFKDVAANIWEGIGEGEFSPNNTTSMKISDIRWRLIHKFIAYTIAGRGDGQNKVSYHDLWYLYNIRHPGTIVSIPRSIVVYLATRAWGPKKKSPMCGGHFVTKIAHFLNVPLEGLARISPSTAPIGMQIYVACKAVSTQGRLLVPYIGQPGEVLIGYPPYDDENPDEEVPDIEMADVEPVVGGVGRGQGQGRQGRGVSQGLMSEIMAGIRGLTTNIGQLTTSVQGLSTDLRDLRNTVNDHGTQFNRLEHNQRMTQFDTSYTLHNMRDYWNNPTDFTPTVYQPPLPWSEGRSSNNTYSYDHTAARASMAQQPFINPGGDLPVQGFGDMPHQQQFDPTGGSSGAFDGGSQQQGGSGPFGGLFDY